MNAHRGRSATPFLNELKSLYILRSFQSLRVLNHNRQESILSFWFNYQASPTKKQQHKWENGKMYSK